LQLDVRHLRLVDAIAQGGTLTRAAAMLNLTQSALSHQLRDIEDRLGANLFARETRRMVLTPAGERLLSTAKSVLEQISAVETEIRNGAGNSRVELRISTGCYTCYHWLPPRLIELRKKLPLVEVEIVADYTRRPIEGLLDGKLDLAIVSDSVRNSRLSIDHLFQDEVVAVVPAEHPFAARSYAGAAELAGEQLLVYNVPDSRLSVLQDVLRPAGLTPRSLKKIELTEAIIELARAGLGVAILARWAAKPYLRDERLKTVRLTKRGLMRNWTAVTLKRDRRAPHIEEFIRLLAREPF
jgi:LysR family transcriptional regulator for metE and metH